MIRRDHDIGRRRETEIVKRVTQLREIVVGVSDAGQRGGSIDARCDRVEAVAVVVLAAVRIARPKHQYERFVARLEHRQHDLGRDVGHVGLLRDIGHGGARRGRTANLAVVAASGCRQGKAGLGQGGFHLIRQRDALAASR